MIIVSSVINSDSCKSVYSAVSLTLCNTLTRFVVVVVTGSWYTFIMVAIDSTLIHQHLYERFWWLQLLLLWLLLFIVFLHNFIVTVLLHFLIFQVSSGFE